MYDSTSSRAPVEVGSLSSLTALAADPPLNPRQPSLYRREPLTLYVARVPGSRDVFLTPLKPRTKTVTAEDVDSCLYYLHFESPEDDAVMLALKSDFGDEATRHPQGRPLPATPEELPALPPRPKDLQPQDASTRIVQDLPRPLHATIKRKPVSDHTYPTLRVPPTVPSVDRRPPDFTLPPLPPRPASEVSYRSSTLEYAAPTAILVRRDPSLGMQWNVARFTDPPVHDVSSTSSLEGAASRRKGSPIYLDIYTQGYQKFMPAGPPLNHLETSSGRATPDSIPSLEYSGTDSSAPTTASGKRLFSRRMWMEGSHFLGGRNRDNRLSDMEGSDEPLCVDGASPSYQRLSSPRPTGSTLELPNEGRLEPHGGRRSSAKGYTFLSPWQGRCEFATSLLGSSLKCRHRLPGFSEAIVVSELRFNLPSRSSHRKSASHSSAVDANSHRPRITQDRRTQSVSFVGDDFERISLSLGQELAGGGATGKHAKLGKLIIEHEGLQMLDLIVATNMSLWQRAYNYAAEAEPS